MSQQMLMKMIKSFKVNKIVHVVYLTFCFCLEHMDLNTESFELVENLVSNCLLFQVWSHFVSSISTLSSLNWDSKFWFFLYFKMSAIKKCVNHFCTQTSLTCLFKMKKNAI